MRCHVVGVGCSGSDACVYQGKESSFLEPREAFLYRVDEVRIPAIFAFFCDMSLVVAAFVSTLGSGSVTYRTSPSVTVHSRKQKCVFGSAGLALPCGGLNPSKPRWFPYSRGGTKPVIFQSTVITRQFNHGLVPAEAAGIQQIIGDGSLSSQPMKIQVSYILFIFLLVLFLPFLGLQRRTASCEPITHECIFLIIQTEVKVLLACSSF